MFLQLEMKDEVQAENIRYAGEMYELFIPGIGTMERHVRILNRGVILPDL